MNKVKKVYWDANAWIGLINREPSRVRSLEVFYHAARRGDVQIWTSVISEVEVYKMQADPTAPRSLDEQNQLIDSMLHQPFVQLIEVNGIVTGLARDLLRAHPGLKKPYDAVHLASALRWDVDALHTYDRANLLGLDKKLKCRNNSFLEICHPELDPDGPLLASAAPKGGGAAPSAQPSP